MKPYGALLKTGVFTVLVPVSVTILMPRLLFSHQSFVSTPLFLTIPGACLILAGTVFYMKCAWDFAWIGKGTPAPIDAPKTLIERGLYRLTRNPMYVGILMIVTGESLIFYSGVLFLYAVLLWLAFHLMVSLYEEPHLKKAFGSSYEEYCKQVPRWFCFPRSRKLFM